MRRISGVCFYDEPLCHVKAAFSFWALFYFLVAPEIAAIDSLAI